MPRAPAYGAPCGAGISCAGTKSPSPTYLRTRGYRTGIFGKWHLGDNYPYRPFDRGFRESLSFGGGVVGEIPDYWDNDNFTATYLRNGAPEPHSCYCTDVWFNEAMQFMEADETPFFCYISTNAPHGPFNVHEKYSAPYLQQGIPKQRARFYGMIANIDENIGHLRQWLADNNLTENTILIFMGDNGTSMGTGITADGYPTDGYNAGMRGKKTWVYDGGHRNACFIHWPAGKPDRRSRCRTYSRTHRHNAHIDRPLRTGTQQTRNSTAPASHPC